MVNSADINLILLTKPELVFFGLLSASINKKVIESKDGKCYAYSDGKTIWYVCPEDTKLDVYVGLTIHCLLHIISLHYSRIGNRNKEIWTLACDHVVNRAISELNSKYCKLPKNSVFFYQIHQKYPDITAEALYDLLTNKENCCSCSKCTSGNGSPAIRSNMTTELVADDLGEVDQNHKLDIKDAQNFRQIAQSLALNDENLKSMGRGFKSRLKKILEVKIPWDEILANALRNTTSDVAYKTWAKKNLIFPKLKIPGNIYDLDKVSALIVSVDLSGSISEQQAEKFAKAVATSAKYYKKVIIILHHESIINILECQRPTETKLHDFITENYEVGGTSHKEVFEKIEEIINSGRYMISTILFLTDMESDIFEIYKDFKWIFGYETIWLLPPVEVGYLDMSGFVSAFNDASKEFFSECRTKVIQMDN